MRVSKVLATALYCLIFTNAAEASAQSPTTAATLPAAEGSVAALPISQLTRADLEPWLDGFLPYALQRGDIAGAVIVVVKDGEVLLQKGYGYADVEKRTPVDPERTLFRGGSVGKLFTYTAVMQLVEQGKLDLDTDIGSYLDFKVPEAFGKPVTLRHLLTHSAGFEEMVKQLINSDASRMMPLESYVKATRPKRIFPPGEVPSYCNYCVTLAGYIVQRISGEPFDDYLDHHIYEPLGMRRTTFRQPLPGQLAADMSKGYTVASRPASYFEHLGPAPAGSVSGTGSDFARFMLAHLRAESGGEPALIQPETARLMYGSKFQPAPPGAGMALGFFDRSRNGRRILGHAGDTQFFHSDLLLFMDDGVGLFMSFNSAGKDFVAHWLRTALFEQFTDRYFPAPLPEESTAATAVEHARLLADAGMFARSRRAESTFMRAFNLMAQTGIVANEDGTIVIPSAIGVNGEPKVWREVAPFVWREVGGRERLVARVIDGRVSFVSQDALGGIDVLLPVPAWQSSAWLMPALLVAIAVLLITAIAWPVSALVRRRFGARFAQTGRVALVHRLTRIAAIVSLVFVAGWTLMGQAITSDYSMFGGAHDLVFALLYSVGALAIAGAGIAIWNGWLVWKRGARWSERLWSLALAAACTLVAWFGLAFNLIEASLRY